MALEILLWSAGLLAYAVIGGVVHVMLSRIETCDGAEDVWAMFWPVAALIGIAAGAVWLAAKAGVWCGERIVDGAGAALEWRRRPKLPRATARNGGR